MYFILSYSATLNYQRYKMIKNNKNNNYDRSSKKFKINYPSIRFDVTSVTFFFNFFLIFFFFLIRDHGVLIEKLKTCNITGVLNEILHRICM